MRFNDGAADPKSYAGAVMFGGKERIEDLVRLAAKEALCRYRLRTPEVARFPPVLHDLLLRTPRKARLSVMSGVRPNICLHVHPACHFKLIQRSRPAFSNSEVEFTPYL